MCEALGRRWSSFVDRLNMSMNRCLVGRYFKLEQRCTYFTQELRAGTATFLTMAYILAANGSILTDSGGPCTVEDCSKVCNVPSISAFGCHGTSSDGTALQLQSPGSECKFPPVDAGYQACLEQIKMDLVVATAASSLIGCFIMGMFANMPLGLAPGMGMNAYFTYTVVGFHGSGTVPYRSALAAVFLEGIIFLLIAAFGVRLKLAKMVPKSVRIASMAGIGLFLCFIGLQSGEGVGLVGYNPSTLVTLAACPSMDRAALAPVTTDNGTAVLLPGGTVSGNILCLRHRMQSATFWLGVVGFFLISYALVKGLKGAMIFGIVMITSLSWIRFGAVTYFPHTPQGNQSFNYFKKVMDVHRIQKTAGVLSFKDIANYEFWVALISFLYVDLLDTTGGLYTLANLAGMVDAKGDFEGQYFAFMSD
eukprot:c21329_g1_i1 orf=164-1426(+)